MNGDPYPNPCPRCMNQIPHSRLLCSPPNPLSYLHPSPKLRRSILEFLFDKTITDLLNPRGDISPPMVVFIILLFPLITFSLPLPPYLLQTLNLTHHCLNQSSLLLAQDCWVCLSTSTQLFAAVPITAQVWTTTSAFIFYQVQHGPAFHSKSTTRYNSFPSQYQIKATQY